ncbi:MAG TPA: hypothetical protein VI248_19025 [Kineosporiaceae bacterium]
MKWRSKANQQPARPEPEVGIWGQLRHAHGAASDIPALLHAASGPASGRDRAWAQLWDRLCHHGSVYSASAAAVPELTRLACDDSLRPADRAQATSLIAAIADGSSYLAVHGPVVPGRFSAAEREQLSIEQGWVQDARRAAREYAPRILQRLDSTNGRELLVIVVLAAEVGLGAAPFADALKRARDRVAPGEQRAAVDLAVTLVRGELLTTEELQARVARLDHEVSSYLQQALTGLPPDTQARALVTMIVADYGSWTPTMPIPFGSSSRSDAAPSSPR